MVDRLVDGLGLFLNLNVLGILFVIVEAICRILFGFAEPRLCGLGRALCCVQLGPTRLGRDDHAHAFVACRDQLEEEVGGLGLERDVADFVDDQKRASPCQRAAARRGSSGRAQRAELLRPHGLFRVIPGSGPDVPSVHVVNRSALNDRAIPTCILA